MTAQKENGPDKTTDPRLDAIARGIHAFDCAESDEARRRSGLPPVAKWADPWHPSGARQLAKLYLQATRIIAELEALNDD